MDLSLSNIGHAVFFLIIAGLVLWVLWWVVQKLAPPEPFAKIINAVLVIVAAAIVIDFLLGFVGYGFIHLR